MAELNATAATGGMADGVNADYADALLVDHLNGKFFYVRDADAAVSLEKTLRTALFDMFLMPATAELTSLLTRASATPSAAELTRASQSVFETRLSKVLKELEKMLCAFFKDLEWFREQKKIDPVK